MNEWTIYLNHWAEYQWNVAMDQYVHIQRAERLSKQYIDFYHRWNQFHEKIEHYEQVVQKKGLIPPSYPKQLKNELQSFQLPVEIPTETFIDFPTCWLLDSQTFDQDGWSLYMFWYWIYDVFLWNESMRHYYDFLETQNQYYESLINTIFPQWYEETLKRIRQKN